MHSDGYSMGSAASVNFRDRRLKIEDNNVHAKVYNITTHAVILKRQAF